MTTCKHCGINDSTYQWQTQRIAELEDQNRTLARSSEFDEAAINRQLDFKLSPNESAILGLLMLRNRVSREVLVGICKHPKDEPHPSIIDVYVSRLRRKLAPLKISIIAIREYGYYIPREDVPRIVAKAA